MSGTEIFATCEASIFLMAQRNDAQFGRSLAVSLREVCSEEALVSFNRLNISRRSLLPRTMTTSVMKAKDDPATIKFAVQK
jgi:hypothetical protein